PNVIIAQERNVLKKDVADKKMNFEIYYHLLKNSRSFANKGRTAIGYDYSIPTQWQGRFTKLFVIGDKKARVTSDRLRQNSQELLELQKIIQIDINLIHMIRNPYDTITTLFKRQKEKNATSFGDYITFFFQRVETIKRIEEIYPKIDIYHLRLEELITQPKLRLAELLTFLGLTASEEYLDDCAKLIYKSPRKTRYSIDWSEEQIERVKNEMTKYPYFKDYSFEN
ncbi:MAG: sulfotransferase domain-containing protein, partial [Candidatus Hodarchaeota archaeon]